jgi:nucleoside phosphorylase
MGPRKKLESLDSPKRYTVAWIAALPHERAAATAVLDEEHDTPADFGKLQHDPNQYTWGSIGNHHVVITSLPSGVYGTTAAGLTANQLLSSLPHIRFGLMVGIGAGVPQPNVADVRLGDVVVSKPHGSSGGVIQHDLVKIKEGTCSTGHLAKPPMVLLHALGKLQSDHLINDSIVPSVLEAMLEKYPKMKRKSPKDPGFTHPGVDSDRLFAPSRQHVGGADCGNCPEADTISRDRRDTTDPEIHYGVIASGNALVKDANERDEILKRLPDNVRNECLCIEMEAAGLMDTFPCIVIRGICDYADSHKNDMWQKYAAATAAAFAKEFLSFVDVQEVERAPELHKAVEKGP